MLDHDRHVRDYQACGESSHDWHEQSASISSTVPKVWQASFHGWLTQMSVLAGWLVGWLAGWLAGWLTGWLVWLPGPEG